MKDSDIEKILLGSKDSKELIAKKIRAEIEAEMAENKKPKMKKIITDITQAPKPAIFSASSVWSIYNRDTRQENLLTGLQAENYLSLDFLTKTDILKGETDCFLTDNYFLKFVSCEIDG